MERNKTSIPVSQAFVRGYLLYGHRPGRGRLALDCGCSPSWLSKVVHGYICVRDGDERIVKVGGRLGLEPEECFGEDSGWGLSPGAQAEHAEAILKGKEIVYE